MSKGTRHFRPPNHQEFVPIRNIPGPFYNIHSLIHNIPNHFIPLYWTIKGNSQSFPYQGLKYNLFFVRHNNYAAFHLGLHILPKYPLWGFQFFITSVLLKSQIVLTSLKYTYFSYMTLWFVIYHLLNKGFTKPNSVDLDETLLHCLSLPLFQGMSV